MSEEWIFIRNLRFRRVGSSLGFSIPVDRLEELGFKVGEEIDVAVKRVDSTDKVLEEQSRENMALFYSRELKAVDKGDEKVTEIFTLATRKRLRDNYQLLKLTKNSYEVSEEAKKIIYSNETKEKESEEE